jgi:hypothetical protein
VDETEPTAGSERSGAAAPPFSRALERAIQELYAEVATPRGDDPNHRELYNFLRRIVYQTRADGLRAEELVIVFRRVWNGLAPASPGAAELQGDRLVSALITAFYEDEDGIL